tara:strand:+ start:202 stop:1425 length:1224 start_codon:yes stop_codon:yes gene_type:complete
MGFILDTLGYAAQRGADIAEQNRIAKRKQEDSFSLLDYQFDQDKKMFDIKQTRAEKQVETKAKRDADKILQDKIKEASLYYKPEQIEAIASYGLTGYDYAIAKAKEYESNGRSASTEFDVGQLKQQISTSDPTKSKSTLELSSTINDPVFSSAFSSIPQKTKKAASTFQAQLVQISSDISTTKDQKKLEELKNREKNLTEAYQNFLNIEKEKAGENFKLDFSKETRTALTLGLLDSNFIAAGKYEQIGDKVGRITRGFEADAATIHFNTYETLLNKYGGKKPGEKWNGVRDLNPEDEAFWASIEQIRIGGTQLVEQYIGQTVREYQRIKSPEDDKNVITKPLSFRDRKNELGGLLTFPELIEEYNKGIYKSQDVVPFTENGENFFGLISSTGMIHRMKQGKLMGISP